MVYQVLNQSNTSIERYELFEGPSKLVIDLSPPEQQYQQLNSNANLIAAAVAGIDTDQSSHHLITCHHNSTGSNALNAISSNLYSLMVTNSIEVLVPIIPSSPV
jgi:hypothetical protein